MSRSIKRTPLKDDLYDKLQIGASLIASGFGNRLIHQFKIGEVVEVTKINFSVRFKDDDGSYTEKYEIKSGVRIDDLGDDEGWMIAKKEFSEYQSNDVYVSSKTNVKKPASTINRFRKLHTEEIPFSNKDDSDVLIIQVWEDTELNQRYLKAHRIGMKRQEGDEVKRLKEMPVMVPFGTVLNILRDWCIDWDEN